MSFTLQRSGNTIIRKSITLSLTPSIVNNSASLGSTGNTDTATINVLTLSGTQITATGNELNRIGGVTPGTASASKALVLDSSRNISNINQISCSNLLVNGVQITSGGGGGGSGSTPVELTGVTPGTAEASKALVLDSSRNITNINNVTLNKLTIPTNVGNTIAFTDWTTNITPSMSTTWNKIIYVNELELYIALTSANTSIPIMTSPDGITWTNRSISGTARFWNNLCWSPVLKMCVVVGQSGYTAYSYNGITWTQNAQISGASSANLEAVVWMSRYNVFYAANNAVWANDDSGYFYSSTGRSWIKAKKSNGGFLKAGVYAPSLGRAVFIGNGASATASGIVYEYIDNQEPISNINVSVSTSGSFPMGSTLDRRMFRSIDWSEELGIFVAIATATTFTEFTILYSSTGITWSAATSPVNANWSRVIWCSKINIFVAVSDDSTGSIMITSPDGINWSQYNNFITTNTISDIVWNPYRLELVGISRNNSAPIRVFLTQHSYSDSNNIVLGTNNILGNSSSSTLVSKDNIIYNSTNSGNHVFTSNNRELVTITANGCVGINDCVGYEYPIELNTKGTNAILIHTLLSGQQTSSKTAECSINLDHNGVLYINTYTSTNTPGDINLFNSWINLRQNQWKINNSVVNASSAQINYLAGTTLGQAIASKAVILDANRDLTNLRRLYIGGSLTPTNVLELGLDNAVKPSTSTWTVASDQRLKEDIEDADLNICYNNIKTLKLRYYKWKDDVYTTEQVADRHKIGWIADEVQQVIPKAVTINNTLGLEDCKTLNTDQIIANMYGTIQKLIQKVEKLEDFINSLEISSE